VESVEEIPISPEEIGIPGAIYTIPPAIFTLNWAGKSPGKKII